MRAPYVVGTPARPRERDADAAPQHISIWYPFFSPRGSTWCSRARLFEVVFRATKSLLTLKRKWSNINSKKPELLANTWFPFISFLASNGNPLPLIFQGEYLLENERGLEHYNPMLFFMHSSIILCGIINPFLSRQGSCSTERPALPANQDYWWNCWMKNHKYGHILE